MTNTNETVADKQKHSYELPKTLNCKVIPNRKDVPTSSKEWTRAKKCSLTVDKTQLIFDDNTIRYEDIEHATITIYQSALFFEYGILSVNSHGVTHHFGIKYDDFWKGPLPFEVDRVSTETPFLLFRKGLILLIIVYIFWEVVKNSPSLPIYPEDNKYD